MPRMRIHRCLSRVDQISSSQSGSCSPQSKQQQQQLLFELRFAIEAAVRNQSSPSRATIRISYIYLAWRHPPIFGEDAAATP
ncbi:hypothetical protein VPH35_107253 [Triticum aestivum]